MEVALAQSVHRNVVVAVAVNVNHYIVARLRATTDARASTVFPGYYQLLTWSGTSYVDAKLAGIESGRGYWALVLVPTHINVQKP